MRDYTYLIGPMENCTVEHMKGWRAKADTYLEEAGIPVLDPTRRISFHDQMEGTIQDSYRSMNVCKRIFKMDLQDIANSRVVLADVRRSSGKGTGSACELMFSHMKNKIIILWADPADPIHPFLEAMATEKYYDLNEALKAVSSYY
jgi:hypothetical protein